MVRGRVLVALLACVAIAGCKEKPPPADQPSGPNPITGNERLGWDQQAANGVELATYRYAIYVDGARSEVADASCSATPGPAGFACSGRFPRMTPGAHTLELATFLFDNPALESARSAPFSVTVTSSALVGTASVWQENATVTTLDGVRLRLELVADGVREPTDAAFTPGGDLLIAEREGRVRIIRGGRLLAEPTVVLADVEAADTAGLLSLALDPRFNDTHYVFVLYTARSRAGELVFHLARYREVDGVLVERVILLDDVPASRDHPAASLRFGPDGKLFVAFDDGDAAQRAGDQGSFSGKLLRMNADRSTPGDQAGASPVFSQAYRSPRGIDWQVNTGILWIADGDPTGVERLNAVGSSEGLPKRAVARAAYELPAATGASALSFYRSDVIAAFRGNLFVAADYGRHILRLQFDASDSTRIVASERLLQDRVGAVRVVLAGPDGSVYFCTAHEVGRLVAATER